METKHECQILFSCLNRNVTEIGCRNNDGCSSQKACMRGRCADPCTSSNPCEQNQECQVVDHQPVCIKGLLQSILLFFEIHVSKKFLFPL